MRRRARPLRPLRRRIFIGCEGKSEYGYAALLQRLAEEAGLALHIQRDELAPGAGDPLELVRKAVRLIEAGERQRPASDRFIGRFLLLDDDRKMDDPGRFQAAEAFAESKRLRLIIQRPDHEAFLLRHFAGHEHDQPPRGATLARLRSIWPDYRKPMLAAALATQITRIELARAAEREPGLAELLRIMGFNR